MSYTSHFSFFCLCSTLFLSLAHSRIMDTKQIALLLAIAGNLRQDSKAGVKWAYHCDVILRMLCTAVRENNTSVLSICTKLWQMGCDSAQIRAVSPTYAFLYHLRNCELLAECYTWSEDFPILY